MPKSHASGISSRCVYIVQIVTVLPLPIRVPVQGLMLLIRDSRVLSIDCEGSWTYCLGS